MTPSPFCSPSHDFRLWPLALGGAVAFHAALVGGLGHRAWGNSHTPAAAGVVVHLATTLASEQKPAHLPQPAPPKAPSKPLAKAPVKKSLAGGPPQTHGVPQTSIPPPVESPSEVKAAGFGNTADTPQDLASGPSDARSIGAAEGLPGEKSSGGSAPEGPENSGPTGGLGGILKEVSARTGYPPLARRMGKEGLVGIRLCLTASGTFQKPEVQHSSGSRLLDEGALEGFLKSPRRIENNPDIPCENKVVTLQFALQSSSPKWGATP